LSCAPKTTTFNLNSSQPFEKEREEDAVGGGEVE
jgi:hypothetical protein